MKKIVALTLCACTVVVGTFAFRPRTIEVGAFRPRSIESEHTQEYQEAGMRMFRR